MAALDFQSPITQQVARGQARLVTDYHYTWRYRHDKNTGHYDCYRIIVPKGFQYNGASIPRIFWTIFGVSPFGAMDAPSVVHDFLYENKGDIGDYFQKYSVDFGKFIPTGKKLTRKEADYIFLWVMQDSNFFKEWRMKLAYKAVDLFGEAAWQDDD